MSYALTSTETKDGKTIYVYTDKKTGRTISTNRPRHKKAESK